MNLDRVRQAVSEAQDAIAARRVYCDPVERDGTTVISAAAVGGGGGTGVGTDESGREAVAVASAWAAGRSVPTFSGMDR